MSHRHCNDFTRAGFLREAAAEAGRGLPPIEPGMPLPAGTGLDRRAFLLRGGGLALSVFGASKLGIDALDFGVAQAAAATPDSPVLVSVFLEGGIDSMTMLAPTGDARYRRLRPRLAVSSGAGTPFADDRRLRWHPAASSFAKLHAAGKLAVMPAVGYDHPNLSHFTSRHFYEVGEVNSAARTGWLGRYLDYAGDSSNPLQGLTLGRNMAPNIAAAKVPVAALSSPSRYEFRRKGVFGDVDTRLLDAIADIGSAHAGSGDAALAEAGATAVDAGTLQRRLAPFASKSFGAGYPKANGNDTAGGAGGADGDLYIERLAGLAAILDAGLPIRCVALSAPGDYDTHANQGGEFLSNLKLTADGLLAFQQDLERRGLADRVLIHVWSEFGRRAAENGSHGTDHGAAGMGMLIGSRVRGGMIGEFPGLGKLDVNGNLRATSDFRSIYSSILEQWFQVDAAAVIPGAGQFGRHKLIG